MTAGLFLGFLALVVLAVSAVAWKYLPRDTAFRVLGGLAVWLGYVGVLSRSGYVADAARRPPGVALIVLPAVLFAVGYLPWSRAALRVAVEIPVWLLLGFQVFRVGVELLFHRLWLDGLVPRMLTYRGANFDILAGLSAPVIAWVSLQGRTGLRWALAWNVVGLLLLGNIAVRAVMTSPGPLHRLATEVPNMAFGIFPFTYIPGFLAPLALVLHVLAIRAIRMRLRSTLD